MRTEPFVSAFFQFALQPSAAHRAELLTQINAYPATWGAEMAEGRNIGEAISTMISTRPPSYEPKRLDKYVTADTDGNRLSLLFKTRSEAGIDWHVLSWRSVYPGTNSNRRFYMAANGEPWSTSSESALAALEHAENEGWLDDAYLDLRRRPECDVVDSRELNNAARREYLDSFIVPGESFEDPELFVVCEDSNQSWRKMMLIHEGRATFRSVTTNPDYGVLKHLDNGQDWNLDNSMQDCNVQQARAFLSALRSLGA